jgi:hypothetical protein
MRDHTVLAPASKRRTVSAAAMIVVRNIGLRLHVSAAP